MTIGVNTTAKPVFDSSLTFLAINTLEDELEEADCFGNIHYSEIQENCTVKRRVLRHENLREDWLKVLRSGEVLVTMFHMSDKVRSVLDKHSCPLQPVLEGNEHSNWQRLRTQFLCNWQSFYSVIEYLQQYSSVKVDGLDSSGKIIVDCADAEMARVITMGALTQCFILLGKQPLASLSDDHALRPANQGDKQEDTNNNAGSASKALALQPKVSRLGNKKRVICIYDTTTSEGSDQASIEATPIDNRNSTGAASKEQQQQQQQEQKQLQQQEEQKHQHQQQPDDEAVPVHSNNSGLLVHVLRRLDEVKALLLNGPTCSSCQQRVLDSLHNSDGAQHQQAVEVVAPTTNAVSPPFPQNAHSVVADAELVGGSLPCAVASSAVADAAPAAAPADSKLATSRKRVIRKMATKRTAVPATKLATMGKQVSADGLTGASRRSQTKVTARSTDGPTEGAEAPGAVVAAVPTKKVGKKGRGKVVVRRRAGVAKSSKQDTSANPAVVLPSNSNAEKKTSESGRPRAASGDHRKKSVQAAAVAAAVGTVDKQQKQPPRKSSTTVDRGRQQSSTPDAARSVSRSIGGGGGHQKQKGTAAVSLAAGGGSGNNGNNDGGGVKRITKSTVQDLINKLQAVLNEDV